MPIQQLIPGPIKKVLDYAAHRIEEGLNQEVWDEATAYLIDKLRTKREEGNLLMGMKFLCDTKEHITDYEKKCAYKVIKN